MMSLEQTSEPKMLDESELALVSGGKDDGWTNFYRALAIGEGLLVGGPVGAVAAGVYYWDKV